MTALDLRALVPLVILGVTPVVVLLVIAIRRSHAAAAAITLVGLAATFRSLWLVSPIAPREVTPLLLIDHYALLYVGLLVAAAFVVTLLAFDYLARHAIDREELYVLLLVATLGSAVLVCSSHFASFFLGLEVLSVSLYGMVAYVQQPRPIEAGLKYLVLAAASSAFLLFGMALVYAAFGTMQFQAIAYWSQQGSASRPLVAAGLVFLVTGVGFKLAVVPFHMWTPDVYEGAPAPVTAFVATVSKGGMFGLLIRFFGAPVIGGPVALVFAIIAIASMFAGNLLALRQANVKRILAYSSIAHLGYFLVAFLAGGRLGVLAATYYLAAYFVTILGAFGVVSVLSIERPPSLADRRELRRGPADAPVAQRAGAEAGDADSLDDYRGLFWRRPVLAVVFSGMLLSLAGIPLTAGFLGKFYVVAAGANTAAWTLVISLIVSSVIGLYYYLRVLAVMYEPEAAPVARHAPRAAAAGVALAGLTILLVWFGVYPSVFLRAIRLAVAALPGS